MDVTCPRCGATWPSADPAPVCPICAGIEPNEGGSPAGPESEDEALLDALDEHHRTSSGPHGQT